MSVLPEKLVVVTGASAGLGQRVCQNLVAQGFRVVGLSRRGEAPEGVDARVCDVSDYASVEAALEDVSKDKSLFALINCAGIASMNLVMATPPETINRIIATNLIGTINTCRLLSKRFARNKGGRIINFSTVAVPISLKGEAIYVASKAGVEGFSRAFAREMADFDTTVNVIAPGPIDTQLIAGVPHAAIERIIERQIIPKRFTPDAVEDLVQFLLSDQSSMLSGQILNIGGA
jgi:3-oxoacyl-[acyl-carrier protein] reductase